MSDSEWFARDDEGAMKPLGSQDEIDETVASGNPVYVMPMDQPADAGSVPAWPEGWVEIGSTGESVVDLGDTSSLILGPGTLYARRVE